MPAPSHLSPSPCGGWELRRQGNEAIIRAQDNPGMIPGVMGSDSAALVDG